jgi:hypothetical protein
MGTCRQQMTAADHGPHMAAAGYGSSVSRKVSVAFPSGEVPIQVTVRRVNCGPTGPFTTSLKARRPGAEAEAPAWTRWTVPLPVAADVVQELQVTSVAMVVLVPHTISRVAGLYAPPPQLGTVAVRGTVVGAGEVPADVVPGDAVLAGVLDVAVVV